MDGSGPDGLALFVWASKAVYLAAALLSAGLAIHVAMGIADRGASRRLHDLAALFSVIAALLLGVRLLAINAQLAGSLTHALDETSVSLLWKVYSAAIVAFSVGALLIVLSALFRSRALALLGSLVVAASFVLTGHIHDDSAFLVLALILLAHLAIAAFWVAAPISLWPSRRIDQPTLVARMRGFSRVAVIAVPLLFVAGAVLAVRLTGSINGMIATGYGQLLLVKIAVATAALGLGAVNRAVVTRRLEGDFENGKRLLRRSLAGESLLFLLAIGIVAWITTVVGPPM